MKKIISLFLAVLLLMLSVTSCGRKPKMEEIKPRMIELIEASYEINDIFFGEGLDRVDFEEEYEKIIAEYAGKRAEAEKQLMIAEKAYLAMMESDHAKTEEEIAAAKKRVEDAEKEVQKNVYMFTKEEFLEQYDTDATYAPVRSDKYVTVNDIKAEAEKVYSSSYLMSIYETMFVGYIEKGVNDIIYARYYDSPDGLKMLKESDIWITEKRVYDYDSMKIVRPSNSKRITVEINSHLENSTDDLLVRLSLVKQGDQWYLDSPTY